MVMAQNDPLRNPLEKSSVGETGIDALRLHKPPYNLTGRKIAIGQVEIGRPGQFGIDKEVSRSPWLNPARVFFRDAPIKSGKGVDGHAHNVASVMISFAKAAPGVAPDARLYASAAGKPKKSGQPEECLAAQYIANQNGGDVRAINFSFGESLQQDPRPDAILDGNALLTQCIDWSARIHNVLYVIAGNQGKGGIPIPTDNFNGVNVAFSMRVDGIFAKADFANLGDISPLAVARFDGTESNLGARRSIGLIAPGNNILMVNLDGSLSTSSGTSFAAPHVTATVALLQEYGDRQLATSCKSVCKLPWGLNARQHEVMKAVLLNSADKVKDKGDGLNLGMTRTILDKSNRNWLDSDAYRDAHIPLDLQMGTGQLNAYRAYLQFSPGQWSPATPVPTIGWDYRSVGVANPQSTTPAAAEPGSPGLHPSAFQDYLLEKPLQAGSFISVTLTWDRMVDLIDANQNGEYEIGENFRAHSLNNLDLYLMRAEDSDPRQAIWSSVSEVDSIEHIFQKIPKTGQYKIRVQFHQQLGGTTQPYALAWWAKSAESASR
ncbi:MAG: S8 family serine peptidase [Scytolyngbya sp. HA4215-MV1]|nr:S8 family serine peptidase [Scytolyngbya sp. HA4215-MV1]